MIIKAELWPNKWGHFAADVSQCYTTVIIYIVSKYSTSLWFQHVEICVRLPLLTLLPSTPCRCPFCNFPALLDKDMSLFSCPNPRCRKVSPLSRSKSNHQSNIFVSCNPVSEFYHYVRRRHCSCIKRKSVGIIWFGVVVKDDWWIVSRWWRSGSIWRDHHLRLPLCYLGASSLCLRNAEGRLRVCQDRHMDPRLKTPLSARSTRTHNHIVALSAQTKTLPSVSWFTLFVSACTHTHTQARTRSHTLIPVRECSKRR